MYSQGKDKREFASISTRDHAFWSWQKQPLEVFCKKDVCRNFATFTGKHLRQSLFFNKAAGISNFIKNEALAQVFSCDFTKFLIATFSQNTSGGCFCQEYFWITSWKPMLYVYLLLLLQRIHLLNKKIVVVFIRKI